MLGVPDPFTVYWSEEREKISIVLSVLAGVWPSAVLSNRSCLSCGKV